jgi:multicomponent Na+:H+ antiporter subunit C
MTPFFVYMLSGVVLFVMGLFSLLAQAALLRKILAFNVMGGGVFMVLVALAHSGRSAAPATSVDPVPHALVLTGIVVAVSATALALALACRYHADTGRTTLPEDAPR